MNTIIKTDNLTKVYKSKAALSGINFSLYEGDICALIGNNGAGKTTLMKTIAGIIFPSSGSFSLFGDTGSEVLRQRKRIGFVLENNFFENYNAYQNLDYFRRLKGITDKRIISEVLRIVDMEKNSKKKFKEYSTGMKQRLGLALALMSHPDVLVLDEPTNGLDPEGINDMRRLLVDLNRNENITILVSSHILSELQSFATRFVFIDEGKLVGDISREEFDNLNTGKILVTVDDAAKASQILESHFDNINYSVLPNNTISITDKIEIKQVSKVLINANIGIYEIKNVHETLEEHFLNTVGGKK